ncbi:family transcriptional regulator : LuxR family transcriptional regulator OS=Myxococcus stipitatus (strain DSM 14675 / JCM 12634 / Mx s8) GN=MYSTI_00406 PE=4 SV=1: GerE [Gemmataceae bacterium]|nr:family transcriptional regulator : LuxR family transcriptional regulator OS=Myxococcus stipitatus (strain DSM 14675 / JCM 12634 / Mx s8) GN=MYSTI_00406 PE=4 SV=1: GerE [Gemmataceae bacterium]VTT98623.1 family transcriptional regulator : LuxR family transcriptional regulator OS=Myxococcus stipitatus (strain DSM 14675 / JCM 12634 / Mx s8) GN=MYSTI_00406 PE=4 SV=1: GerE [Gemmataceae bacterium]
MRKSQRVRAADVAFVDRLFDELGRLPVDNPRVWSGHLLDTLRRLLGCPHTGVWLRVVPADGRVAPGPMRFFEQSGLTPGQRTDFHRLFVSNPGARHDPLLAAARSRFRPGTPVTYRREELVPERDWYRSHYVDGFRRSIGFDHTLTSAVRLGDGLVFGIGGWHEWGQRRPFGERSHALLHHVVGRLGWMAGQLAHAQPPASPPPVRITGTAPRLSPREGDTLSLLLAGCSEKEVAARLRLSPRTVHEYVTALYRKFGVHSRSELLACWVGDALATPIGEPTATPRLSAPAED